MRFLLVNENIAVKKLFNISAKKADIVLDIVDSVGKIPMQEDYVGIFVDDGVFDLTKIQNIKNAMITTKFYLIISKNREIEGVLRIFDEYIRKPFLPTAIYDIFKAEKYNEMQFEQNSLEGENLSGIDIDIDSENSLQGSDVSDLSFENIGNVDESLGIGDESIDLSQFNDNEDEFISGTKDEPLVDNDLREYDFTSGNMSIDDLMNSSHEIGEGVNFLNDANMVDTNVKSKSAAKTINDINNEYRDFGISEDFVSSGNMGFNDGDSVDTINGDLSSDNFIDNDINNLVEDESYVNEESSDEYNNFGDNLNTDMDNEAINGNTQNSDDIDFSSIFAMQDEFLNSQRRSKSWGLIGGDISIRKDEVKQSQVQESASQELDEVALGDKLLDSTDDDFMVSPQEFIADDEISLESRANSSIIDFEDNSQFGDFSHIDSTKDVVDELQGSNGKIDTTNKSIEELSESELESLDDEELLRLQEDMDGILEPQNNDFMINDNAGNDFVNNDLLDDSLINEASNPQTSPKILNKDDIDEVSSILKQASQMDSSELKIQSNDFSSITEEALSEVLNEDLSSHNDFGFAKSHISQTSQISNNQQTQVNVNQISPSNMDLIELVKNFPIDKLRDLLSGAQITINITFPTKKD